MDYIFWSSILASGNVTLAPTNISYDPHDAPTVTNTVTSTFTSAFIITYLLTIIASYDIVCQWLKGLFARRSRLPPHLQLPITSQQIKGKIPKFHFDAHGKKDHAQYSFNYTKGAGQNEGEGVERNWSYIKSGVGQTVEMGPGGWHDVLDDFFGYCNYRKMTDIGEFYARRLTFIILILSREFSGKKDAQSYIRKHKILCRRPPNYWTLSVDSGSAR